MSAVLIVVGALLVIGGAAWAFPPAGVIVAGLAFLAAGVDLADDSTPTATEGDE